MSLSDLHIKSEYRSLSDNIVKDFYIPLLSQGVLYRRAVGFFSSSALYELSKGIKGLIKNGGKIHLIASPKLSEEDINAINKGYEERGFLVELALLKVFEEYKDYFELERLNILANLIAKGQLEIKIAFTKANNNIGIYHEKMGIISDLEGNMVAFSGSSNETSMAFYCNYETIDAFCSWQSSFERTKVLEKSNAFKALWSNSEKNIETIKFPEIAERKLLSYKREYKEIDDVFMVREALEKYYIEQENFNFPKIPEEVNFYDYQIKAIKEWNKSSNKGIFDMATGTGKTFTALGAIVDLSNKLQGNLAVVIVCPFQHLVEQWVEDLKKFSINPIIGYSSSPQKDWKSQLDKAVLDQNLKVKGRNFLCLICTNATYSSQFVQQQITKIKGDALLVIDEAHNFGSKRLSSLLPKHFDFRLALSATLERYKDEEGTEKLKSYFGEKSIEYSLERAIEEKKLTSGPFFKYLIMKRIINYGK